MAKWFSEVFWCEAGSGFFSLRGTQFTLSEGEIFYLLPGEIHDLTPRSETWTYYWFTLDHKQSAAWLESFGFINRPFAAGPVPVDAFQSLAESLQEGTPHGDRQAAHYAHEILLAATEQKYGAPANASSSCAVTCREIIDQNYTNPNLNVNDLASNLNVHRSTLFRAFKQTHRMTPSTYLQNRRLHHAMELLKTSKLTVQEIALQSGIPDANYLTKLMRRKTGFAPREFRSSYRKGRLNLS